MGTEDHPHYWAGKADVLHVVSQTRQGVTVLTCFEAQISRLDLGAIGQDARSRPTRTWMFCEAGTVKIQLDTRGVPDLDPGPPVQRVRTVTPCRVRTGVSKLVS